MLKTTRNTQTIWRAVPDGVVSEKFALDAEAIRRARISLRRVAGASGTSDGRWLSKAERGRSAYAKVLASAQAAAGQPLAERASLLWEAVLFNGNHGTPVAPATLTGAAADYFAAAINPTTYRILADGRPLVGIMSNGEGVTAEGDEVIYRYALFDLKSGALLRRGVGYDDPEVVWDPSP